MQLQPGRTNNRVKLGGKKKQKQQKLGNINNKKNRHPNNEVFEGPDADLLVEGTNLTGTYNSSSCQCSAIKKKVLEY